MLYICTLNIKSIFCVPAVIPVRALSSCRGHNHQSLGYAVCFALGFHGCAGMKNHTTYEVSDTMLCLQTEVSQDSLLKQATFSHKGMSKMFGDAGTLQFGQVGGPMYPGGLQLQQRPPGAPWEPALLYHEQLQQPPCMQYGVPTHGHASQGIGPPPLLQHPQVRLASETLPVHDVLSCFGRCPTRSFVQLFQRDS